MKQLEAKRTANAAKEEPTKAVYLEAASSN